jgi:hypothetical protein
VSNANDLPAKYENRNMNAKKKDAELRQILCSLESEKYRRIREAYYQAVDGLYDLAEALEAADSKAKPTGGPLLEEHLIAVEAIEAIRKSQLGGIV